MERRRYPRVRVEEEGFVALHNGENRIGRLKDIGLGGLAFEHIYEEEFHPGEGDRNLTLFFRSLRLSKIPCRVVYNLELPIPPEYERLAIRLTTRRCGLQFGFLTDQQRLQLERLLNLDAEDPTDREG